MLAHGLALLFALAGKHLPGSVKLAPTAAGMQVAAWLARGADDRAIAEAGRRAGIALRPLSPYWVGPGARQVGEPTAGAPPLLCPDRRVPPGAQSEPRADT